MPRILDIIISDIQKDRLHRNGSQPRWVNDQIVEIGAASRILVQSLDQRRRIGILFLGGLVGFGGEVLELDKSLVLDDEALQERLQLRDLIGADVEIWRFGGGNGGRAFGRVCLFGTGQGAIEEGKGDFEV